MDIKTLALQALAAISPLVVVWIGWVSTRLADEIRKRVQNERLQKLLTTLTSLVATGVLDAYQTIVAPAKDITKPGEWTEQKAIETKAKVINEVKAAAPGIIDEIGKLGIEQVDSLLHRLVEQEVVAMNGMKVPPPDPPLLPIAIINKQGEQS